MNPPIAPVKKHSLKKHNLERLDDYFWLNDKDNQDVISYLNQENEYTDFVLKDNVDFEKSLFEEIKGRFKEDDTSVPYKLGDYFYFVRYENGKEYPLYCRKKESLSNPEEIILDVNILAEGKKFCQVSSLNISPSHQKLAFAIDTVGRREYSILFKDLQTGEFFEDKIEKVTNDFVWSADDQTLLYVKNDPQTLRSYQVYKYKLGSEKHSLIFQEDDETFNVGLDKTKSKEYIFITVGSTVSTEFRFTKSDLVNEFKVICPRRRDHEYFVEQHNDHFYILTNQNKATNFKICKAPIADYQEENWTDLIKHDQDVFIEALEIFDAYFAIEQRIKGLTQIKVIKWENFESYLIEFDDPTYTVGFSLNPDAKTEILRFEYTSLTTPSSVFDFNMKTKERVLLKQQPVLGDFSSADYTSERLMATAPDGVKVPISIVYKKGFEKNGSRPCFITGYGAYGFSYDPSFSSVRLSLLNRGFVYAIAHCRGGQDLGRIWYEDGKLLKKKNTFSDFIACTEFLITQKYSSADKMFASGGSAGGLLVGVIANERPDLYKAIISNVPFVDVVTTMLDDSIPLTTGEYDEWGNPNDKEYFDYMLSYSPYDNLKSQNYPHILVTSGLHDSQVQYWEPTKYVAKLRTLNTATTHILLHTNMDAGHLGASGRFERFKEVAKEFAFILSLIGIKS